jgi:hypothetical protein
VEDVERAIRRDGDDARIDPCTRGRATVAFVTDPAGKAAVAGDGGDDAVLISLLSVVARWISADFQFHAELRELAQ